jgi:transposase
MSEKFIQVDRKTPFNFSPNMEEWLPEGHLARFIIEIVSRLDLSALRSSYSEQTKGQKAYDPAMMITLIFYCLITGVLSSRKMEQATWEMIPVRFITGDLHPDHATIAAFRSRMKDFLDKIFLDILLIAQGMGLLKLGTVSLDGTKMEANASKHKALSYGYACKLEEQLKAEIAWLMQQSQEEERTEAQKPELNIPEELQRREKRLQEIERAKAEISKREAERYSREKAEYDRKIEERAKKEQETGKKCKGKTPKEPDPTISKKAQMNLTDEDSRIMAVSGGGFEQCYNAQAGVDVDSHIIVNAHVTQACNDKQELEPTLAELEEIEPELGKAKKILCDAGYYSEENLQAAEEAGIEPYIPFGREKHNERLQKRIEEVVKEEEVEEDTTVVQRTAQRMKTEAGRKEYAQRKGVSEPVFGIIKKVMGYSSFLTRGFSNVQKEWKLVCIGYNLKRLYNLFTSKGLKSLAIEINL